MSLYRNKGFVFFILLIYLQLISLYSLYGVDEILQDFKLLNNFRDEKKLLLVAKEKLNKLADLQNYATCLVELTSSYVLLNEPLKWWQSRASCTGNFQQFQYYYVADFLGQDPCARVNGNDETIDYYRITLLVVNKLGNRFYIQGNSAHIDQTAILLGNCKKRHFVELGLQNWHEFI